MPHRLEQRLPPDWDQVKATWDDLSRLFTEAGLDSDTAYALCMAAQELLENAVKYGAYDAEHPELVLRVEVKRHHVTIEVKHPVVPDDARLRRLDDTIQWIRGFQNPFEAYVEKLKQVSAQPYTAGESGLGLARVAYEGQCLLDFYVDDANVLALSAVYQPSHGGLH